MRRFWIVLVSASIMVLIFWYARPILQARVVGVDWWSTLRQSHCTQSHGEVYCTTGWPPSTATTAYTTIQFTPVGRRLLRVDRTWNLADSVTWWRVIDSTRGALNARHREPMPCSDEEMGFPIAEAWRVRSQEIRLYAAPASSSARRQNPWFASIQLVPLGNAGCGPRMVYRLLTPTEIGQAVRDWIAERMGF